MSQQSRQQTKRMGKGMMYAAWILVFILMIWLFDVIETGKRNPNQKVQTHVLAEGQKEIVLRSGRHGHYVTTGRINNEKVTFLVDTGASYVSVPQHVARKAGLQKGRPIAASTANGVVVVYATTLDTISIGGYNAARRQSRHQSTHARGCSFVRHVFSQATVRKPRGRPIEHKSINTFRSGRESSA